MVASCEVCQSGLPIEFAIENLPRVLPMRLCQQGFAKEVLPGIEFDEVGILKSGSVAR